MMIKKRHTQNMIVVLFCLFVLSGCGDLQADVDMMPSVEIQETDFEESEQHEVSVEEDRTIDASTSETLQEIPVEENGVMEIYAGGDRISVSEDIMIAQVSPQEILKGNPIIYDRFRIDGWIFEWLISDYYDDDNWFFEDGVLVISRESDAEDTQIIHVKAEGGDATWVSAKNKFEFVDVNFDDVPDLLICTGHHGAPGVLTYYCFLQTENGFVESPTFTDIPDPAIDAENKLILSQWHNWALSHSWAEFKCQDNEYVIYRELCEEVFWDSDEKVISDEEEIRVWTVNDEVIGRSDELSAEEIDDLIYNENSEWQIAGDRWRTLYMNGLTTDFSIYEEPFDENMEPAALTESNQEEQTKSNDYYEELIFAATECIEGKAEEETDDYDFSYMIYRLGAYYGASMRLGYLIEDIDGNGTDELIFGQNSEPYSAWDGTIYDLYTISDDGELVHVFDGGEKNRYYFCENGMIGNEVEDGFAVSVSAYYIFEGTELHLVEAVLYNDWMDGDNPWFYSMQSNSPYDTENMESISEERARTIEEKYVQEHPVFIPFVEE